MVRPHSPPKVVEPEPACSQSSESHRARASETFRRVRSRLSSPASSVQPTTAAVKLECQDPSSFSSRQSSSCQQSGTDGHSEGKGNGIYYKGLECKTCPECGYMDNKMTFWYCRLCNESFRDMANRESKRRLFAIRYPPSGSSPASSVQPTTAAAEYECQDPSSFSSRQSSSCQQSGTDGHSEGKGNGKYYKGLELKTCPDCGYRGNKMKFWQCYICKTSFRDMAVREEKGQLLATSSLPSASSVQHPWSKQVQTSKFETSQEGQEKCSPPETSDCSGQHPSTLAAAVGTLQHIHALIETYQKVQRNCSPPETTDCSVQHQVMSPKRHSSAIARSSATISTPSPSQTQQEGAPHQQLQQLNSHQWQLRQLAAQQQQGNSRRPTAALLPQPSFLPDMCSTEQHLPPWRQWCGPWPHCALQLLRHH